MTAPASKAELGYLVRNHRCRQVGDNRGKLFYLPRARAIVVPERRHADDWLCLVLASTTESDRRVMVADAEIETALTVVTADPETEPGIYALLWQARVWQRWPGGPMPALARLLADHLRPPNVMTVEVDHAAVRRLAHGTRLLPAALHVLIGRLVSAGLLRPVRPGIGRHWGSYTLAVPDESRWASAA